MITYSFGITATTNPQTTDKLINLQIVKTLLNENLNLLNYTNELSKILIVYFAIAPDYSLRENDYIRLKRKIKTLEIGINLNYSRLLQSSENETIELLAEAYLKGIKLFLLNRKDFDGKHFFSDVKHLFLQHGLIKEDVKKSA